LPYGFNAISNNLTQLLPAAGAAGLAFSGIVTALTFAQIGFGSWTRGIGGATQATQEATKANEEYLSSLAKEKVSLDTLFRTATNANVPLAARLDAVKQLRDNYGAYLKNFTDEEILAGKAANAINQIAQALQNVAMARAGEAELQKLASQKWINEKQIAEERTKLLNAEKTASTLNAASLTARGDAQDRTIKQANIYNKQIDNSNSKIKELTDENANLELQMNAVSVKISSYQKGTEILDSTEETNKNQKGIKERS